MRICDKDRAYSFDTFEKTVNVTHMQQYLKDQLNINDEHIYTINLSLLLFLRQSQIIMDAYFKYSLLTFLIHLFIICKLSKKGMANNYDFMFKFIIIGDSSVGKSCLLLRFTEGRFKNDHEPTLGVQFGSRNINLNNYTLKVQIWDTAGQQSFKSITRSYYKSSIAAFLVFDLTKRDSFDNINKWLFEVKNNSHQKIQTVLIGNKFDLKENRQITYDEAQKFATANGFSYYQTSAQSGHQVEQVFKTVAEKITKMIDNKEINAQTEASYGIKRGKRQKSNSPSPKKGNSDNQDNKVNINVQPVEKKKCCGSN